MIKILIENQDGQSRNQLVVERITLLDGGGKMSLDKSVLNPHQKTTVVVGDGIYFVIREEPKDESQESKVNKH